MMDWLPRNHDQAHYEKLKYALERGQKHRKLKPTNRTAWLANLWTAEQRQANASLQCELRPPSAADTLATQKANREEMTIHFAPNPHPQLHDDPTFFRTADRHSWTLKSKRFQAHSF